ncbi:hypothetical protein [Cylindrospermum sp. FACHB-282]|nr:hypothetical protein [Cylindrospermum sp. FACHB-282]
MDVNFTLVGLLFCGLLGNSTCVAIARHICQYKDMIGLIHY